MRYGRKVVVLALLAALVTTVLCWARQPQEPVWKGKSLSHYLFPEPNAGFTLDQECEAFTHFGTNMLPYLSKALRVRDTSFRRALVRLTAKPPFQKLRVRPATEYHQAALYTYMDFIMQPVSDGRMVTTAADACVPEITALLQDPDPLTRELATIVLHYLPFAKWHANSDGNTQ
jgi:hypothetical protein